MRFDVLTIFPEYLKALDLSLIGKATTDGPLSLGVHNLRDWTQDRHHTVDDSPLGGGAGMVMKPDIWGQALDDVLNLEEDALAADRRQVLVVPTPSGNTFTQRVAEDLATADQVVFACGRYEGIDARVAQHYAARGVEVHELSIGDYVLNGGEAATLVMIEAIARLVPGVVGNPASLAEESHSEAGLLEYPVFTRPAIWRELTVDEVLLSGDHRRIARVRRDQSLSKTAQRRPDLIAALAPQQLDSADRACLARLGWVMPQGSEHPVPAQVHPATLDDVGALVELARATFLDACPPFLDEATVSAHMDAVLTPAMFTQWVSDPRAAVLVAEVAGEQGLAGYAVVLAEQPDSAGKIPHGLDPRPGCVTLPDGVLAGELSKVYVRESLRGSGLAAELLDASQRAAEKLGVGVLWLGTNKDNKRAQKAYKRAGFVKSGRRFYNVGGHRCTDVVMVQTVNKQ